MYAKIFGKDPDAKDDYTLDYSVWLAAGDTISSSAWNMDEPDDGSCQVAGSPAPSNTTTTTTVWLTGGTPGRRYGLRNRVTSVGGRIKDVTVQIVIERQ